MLMGAADIVPGVSGGTVAFITGIYETLIDSLSAFNLRALKLVFGGEFRQAWEQVNGNFLLFLGLGIATSIISLAQLVSNRQARSDVRVHAESIRHWNSDLNYLHEKYYEPLAFNFPWPLTTSYDGR